MAQTLSATERDVTRVALTSAVAVAQVGKAQHVAKTDGVAEPGEEVLDFAAPRLAVAARRATSTSLVKAILVLKAKTVFHNISTGGNASNRNRTEQRVV